MATMEQEKKPMKQSRIEAPYTETNAAVKLARQVQRSEYRMAKYRTTANGMLMAWCGPYYAQGIKPGGDQAEPVNTLATISSIILPNIAGTNVRVHITPRQRILGPFAKLLELRINQVLKDMRFGETMLEGATNALFSCGLFKTFVAADPINHDFEDWLQDPGKPFVDTIHIDDLVFDPDCKKMSAAHWKGHGFMMLYQDALESEKYDTNELGTLRTNQHNMIATLRASDISKVDPYYGDEYTDYIRMIEIYLPSENMIVTIPGIPSETTKFLAEREYDGPEGGEYDLLGFHKPPENPLPVPPINHLYDMHQVINTLVRKLKRDAEQSKTFVLASQAAGIKDAQAVRDIKHGEMGFVGDVNQVKEITIGSSDKATYDALAQFRELQNWIGGNPESIGGLRAGEKTLGQSEMKLLQANIRIADMQKKIRGVEKKIVEKIAWHIWDDKQTYAELEMVLPSGSKVWMEWMAQHREGQLSDYPITIEPYIAQSDNPTEQYKRTMELITQVVLPMAELMQQQGVQVDVPGLLRSAADKLDIHDIDQWFHMAEEVQSPGHLGTAPENVYTGAGRSRSPGGRVSGPPVNAAARQTESKPQPSGQTV